jgi:hypothetical protein
MSAIRIGTGPSHAAVTPPGRTRGRSSWQRGRTCAGDRDPRWPRRRDHVPHRQPHARPARRWPGSWSSPAGHHTGRRPRRAPNPAGRSLGRLAGWPWPDSATSLGCCSSTRGTVASGKGASAASNKVEALPAQRAATRLKVINPECRRPRLVLQPHLLFASLVVCASGASLVAATPSCPGQDEAGLDGCGPHQGDQQPADLGHRRVAEPLGPGRQQLLRA